MDQEKRKHDLEEEMNRFEQEIAGNLPPPPKLPPGMLAPPPMNPSMRPPPFMVPPQFDPHSKAPPRMPFPGPPPLPPRMFGVPPMNVIDSLPPMPQGLPIPAMMVPPPMMNMMPPAPSMPGPSGKILPPTVPLQSYDPAAGSSFHEIFNSSGKPEKRVAKKKKDKKKSVVRVAGGTVWEDETLLEWDLHDFRLFVGDLGNEVSDDALLRAFSRYPSLLKAKVIRDKKTKKSKGFGFVSFKDPQDYLKAMREMNGKYVGNRPIKLRKSTWKDRNILQAKKKEKEKKKLGLR